MPEDDEGRAIRVEMQRHDGAALRGLITERSDAAVGRIPALRRLALDPEVDLLVLRDGIAAGDEIDVGVGGPAMGPYQAGVEPRPVVTHIRLDADRRQQRIERRAPEDPALAVAAILHGGAIDAAPL